MRKLDKAIQTYEELHRTAVGELMLCDCSKCQKGVMKIEKKLNKLKAKRDRL